MLLGTTNTKSDPRTEYPMLMYDLTGGDFHDKNYYCAICSKSRNCDIDTDGYGHISEPCNFEVESRDVVKNKLFQQFDRKRQIFKRDTRDDELTTNYLFLIFTDLYKGSGIEIYDMAIDHKVCPFCNGTGFIINDNIQPCIECNGTGIVTCKIPDGYVVKYVSYEWMTSPNSKQVHMIQMHGIHDTEEQAEMNASMLSNHYGMFMNTCRTLISDAIADCDFSTNGTRFIVIEPHSNKIMAVGNWSQIHVELNVPMFCDIEYYTGEKYQCIPIDKFYHDYSVISKPLLDDVRSHAFVDAVFDYLKHASYKDATNLYISYSRLYPKIDDVRKNLFDNIMNSTGLIYTDKYGKGFLKVIQYNFLMLLGMDISLDAAAVVLSSVNQIVDDVDSVKEIMNEYGAAPVFLIEYVIISPEYANITTESENIKE